MHRYDVVILDRDLPKVHGDEVCRQIVAAGWETRVLMLTAAAGIRDRVDGLDLGADDYLTKPFAFAELVARVGSLGRRARPALPPVLERAGIRLDLPRRQAWRDGLLLELTPKEFAVLEVLMRAEGTVVSAEELLEKAWDENADPFTNAVRVAVMTLRRKLGHAAGHRDRAWRRVPARLLSLARRPATTGPPRRGAVLAAAARSAATAGRRCAGGRPRWRSGLVAHRRRRAMDVVLRLWFSSVTADGCFTPACSAPVVLGRSVCRPAADRGALPACAGAGRLGLVEHGRRLLRPLSATAEPFASSARKTSASGSG